MSVNDLLAEGKIPDFLIRQGIRQRLARTLREKGRSGDVEFIQERTREHLAGLDKSPLAVETAAANEQHYEVPAAFYEQVLGPHLKYSCCFFDGTDDLAEAEAKMLALTCERARLEDGQRILELGCGWGSLSLWMAEHYPKAQITAISNSASQNEFITARARERGLGNLEVKTVDVVEYGGEGAGEFDRVVSVEMFEHLKNYRLLFERIADWLKPGGQLFVHIFTHKDFPYHFEVEREDDWMSRYFFTGGQMPSDDLLLYCQDHLRIDDHWQVNGRHYAKTSRAWLERQDAAEEQLRPILAETYGAEAGKFWHYWRVFFMACEELWNWRGGNEWIVSHYRFRKP